jgi:hypothetical protein
MPFGRVSILPPIVLERALAGHTGSGAGAIVWIPPGRSELVVRILSASLQNPS